MASYLFIYTGGPEMSEWMAWFGTMGEALVEVGNPFSASRTVSANSVEGTGASGITGVSTVSAADIEAAVAIASGCPIIAGGGNVEVYEAMEM